ncbi:MAG: site-specific integrase, partial [Candidatus Levyibacteriota bacterium]
MDIVNNFKNHLFSQKNPPSKVTVKNYLSDVRRFISWYENHLSKTFYPRDLSPHILTAYQTEIMGNAQGSLPAVRSAKRYVSSLRRFGQFLADSGAIEANPFSITETVKPPVDPWHMKEFKNFLFNERASKLTIKNYLIDIKQFLFWLEKVTTQESGNTTANILLQISTYALENYKMRLLHEAQLSPVSINRKLSSIRKYVRWLEEKGIIDRFLDLQEASPVKPQTITDPITEAAPIETSLPLTALQGLAADEQKKQVPTYSRFAPIRLFQKTTKIITLAADLLLISPIAASAEAISYKLLKKGGKKVFAPVKTILDASSYVPDAVSVKTIIPKATSILPPRFANPTAVTKKLINFGITNKPQAVKNFTKALYAPLQISTTHMNWKEKLLYHLRYTRPAWYRA